MIALHCNCHIAALIANHACSIIPKELEELTTDVWYYFHRSAKRMRECKGANGTLDFYVLDVSVCVNCSQFWLFVQLGLVHED